MSEFSEERTSRVTASNAAAFMAKGRGKDETFGKVCHGYAKQIALAKFGYHPEPISTWQMDWGNEYEGPALKVYADNRPDSKVQNGYFVTEGELIGCTPDMFVDEDGLVEVKCPQWNNMMEYLLNGPPKEYVLQMQFQMWVTDRKWCDFLIFHPHFPEGMQAKVFRINRDEDQIDAFRERLEPFMAIVDGYVELLSGGTTT